MTFDDHAKAQHRGRRPSQPDLFTLPATKPPEPPAKPEAVAAWLDTMRATVKKAHEPA